MAKIHNKKRNVGIIYEQLLRGISRSMVTGNEKRAEVFSGIITKHFKPGTQLYKEFRLFNALVKTTVSSDMLAGRILSEAKKAAIDHDAYTLHKEKAALIKEINHLIDDPAFYNQRVEDYRSYATIQTLLNDWRKIKGRDISRVASYESKVCKWLMEHKEEDDVSVHRNDDVNSLTVKIMTEKFNRKYNDTLNDEQAEIIKEYVFSLDNGNTDGFREYLTDIKKTAIDEIDTYSAVCDNQILNEKMEVIRKNINDLSTDQINDDTVSKFLLVSTLRSELLEKDDGR